jgi:hypothetical protein
MTLKGSIDPSPDCALPGERVNYDVEQAYRRGVVQGAHWACALIERGDDVGTVRAWISQRLMPWRLRIKRQRRKTDNTVTAQPAPAPKQGFYM